MTIEKALSGDGVVDGQILTEVQVIAGIGDLKPSAALEQNRRMIGRNQRAGSFDYESKRFFEKYLVVEQSEIDYMEKFELFFAQEEFGSEVFEKPLPSLNLSSHMEPIQVRCPWRGAARVGAL